MRRSPRVRRPDPLRGEKVRWCPMCDDGRARSKQNCDRCGGTGKIRQCRRADCAEYGCGGYGTCYEAEAPVNA